MSIKIFVWAAFFYAAIFMIQACSKGGKEAPVITQPPKDMASTTPPRDTSTTTQPPKDTTKPGGTDTTIIPADTIAIKTSTIIGYSISKDGLIGDFVAGSEFGNFEDHYEINSAGSYTVEVMPADTTDIPAITASSASAIIHYHHPYTGTLPTLGKSVVSQYDHFTVTQTDAMGKKHIAIYVVDNIYQNEFDVVRYSILGATKEELLLVTGTSFTSDLESRRFSQ